jgi:hypothetical protein
LFVIPLLSTPGLIVATYPVPRSIALSGTVISRAPLVISSPVVLSFKVTALERV